MGMIKLFVGNFAPVGYMQCNGQMLQIMNYPALYAVIGNSYGGDGVSTFALPNLPPPSGIAGMNVICVQGLFPTRP